jgi:hypothetical protein
MASSSGASCGSSVKGSVLSGLNDCAAAHAASTRTVAVRSTAPGNWSMPG